MGLDFVKEDQIGRAAAEKIIEELKKVPLIIQIRNADMTVGSMRITGTIDIGIHIGDLSKWVKAV